MKGQVWRRWFCALVAACLYLCFTQGGVVQALVRLESVGNEGLVSSLLEQANFTLEASNSWWCGCSAGWIFSSAFPGHPFFFLLRKRSSPGNPCQVYFSRPRRPCCPLR